MFDKLLEVAIKIIIPSSPVDILKEKIKKMVKDVFPASNNKPEVTDSHLSNSQALVSSEVATLLKSEAFWKIIDKIITRYIFFLLPNTQWSTLLSPYSLYANLSGILSRRICTKDEIRQLNKGKPSLLDFAILAQHVYGNRKSLPVGWSVFHDFDEVLQLKDKKTNLKSQIYRKTINGSQDIYVYAIAGTENVKDWHANIGQLYGCSDQYNLSLKNAQKLVQKISASSLIIVGHSLGGGQAANIAMRIPNCRAVTFNPAGVSPCNNIKSILPPNNKNNIDAYILQTDPLNIVQDIVEELPSADGHKHYIEPKQKWSMWDNHTIKNVIESLMI